MIRLKKLRSWCPQPKTTVPTNIARLSPPVLAGILIAQIIILIIIPTAYYAFLVPKKLVYGPEQYLPLTDKQISAAWPNLPTVQEIVASGSYSTQDSNVLSRPINYTWMNPASAAKRIVDPTPLPFPVFERLSPIEYHIWLQLNDTTFIGVGERYLATNNPPYTLPSPTVEHFGFLNTGLATEYVIVAVIIVLVTLAIGTGYFLHKANIKIHK